MRKCRLGLSLASIHRAAEKEVVLENPLAAGRIHIQYDRGYTLFTTCRKWVRENCSYRPTPPEWSKAHPHPLEAGICLLWVCGLPLIRRMLLHHSQVDSPCPPLSRPYSKGVHRSGRSLGGSYRMSSVLGRARRSPLRLGYCHRSGLSLER